MSIENKKVGRFLAYFFKCQFSYLKACWKYSLESNKNTKSNDYGGVDDDSNDVQCSGDG